MTKGSRFSGGYARGQKIDFDHSYQLCGQCHFRQKRDWLGGAHGKRETYWAGERVVRNCTSCHNPHSLPSNKNARDLFSALRRIGGAMDHGKKKELR